MNRLYYPLTPTKGTWRQPRTVYAAIETDAGGKFICAGIIADGCLDLITDLPCFIDWLRSLIPGTWVITYEADYIPSIFPAAIDHFIISAYGQDTQVIKLTQDEKSIYVISIFQYFGKSLYKLAEQTGMNTALIHPRQRFSDLFEYVKNKTVFICGAWSRLAVLCGDLFGIYPSKTPGATAIKTWRTRMPQLLFPKGRMLRELNQNSISAGGVHWLPGHYPTAYKYDVNACYPFVMSVLRYPVVLTGFTNHPPQTDKWIATVRINYKCNHRFSPLAIRLDNGNITHPETAHNLRCTLTYIDYQVLSMKGEIEIIQWIEGVCWNSCDEVDLFGQWVKSIENEINYNPTSKTIMKVFTRALHSKFAQKPKGALTEIRRIKEKEILSLDIRDIYILDDGGLAAQINIPTVDKFQAYIHPEYEALTQAGAKLIVYSAIDQNTIYVDTDCIISTVPRPDLSIGNRFGQWKLDGYGDCYISGPRSYAIEKVVKSSGVKAVDYRQLQRAVIQAAQGNKAYITAIESTTLSNPFGGRRERRHTLQRVNYPHSETTGGRAFITASPTVEYKIKFINRIFSKLEA